MRNREQLIELLKEILPVMDSYMFSDVEGSSYNNEDMISASNEVRKALEEEDMG